MRLLRPTSLRQRLLLISTVVTLVTLVIAATLIVIYDMRTLRAQMIRDIQVLSEVVGDNCVSSLVFDDPETAENNLGSLAREYQIRYAVLYDAQGRRFALYQRDAQQVPRDPRVPDEGVSVEIPMLGVGTIEVLREIHFDGRLIGRLFIHAGMDELSKQFHRYIWFLGLACLVALAVSSLLAARLQRQVSGSILRLADKARQIAQEGNYALRISPPEVEDEIAVLFRGFNTMLEQIEGRDHQLQRARGDLERTNADLRRLAADMALVSEREKKRLAGELHDSPMQKLALAQSQLASAMQRRDKESDALLEVGLELLRDALRELRTLQFELSPPVLYQEGLAPALQWLASNTRARFGIDLSFTAGTTAPEIRGDLGVCLYQCVRELVHNLVRHADASAGNIELDVRGQDILITVSDNGRGLPPTFPIRGQGERPRYGLFSVRERLALLGGDLSLASDASGTRATVRVPLGSPADDAAIDVRQVTMEGQRNREQKPQ